MLYAFGEILLVVIGILIALEIDTWNDDRQLKKLELKYLKEMITNLEMDLVDIGFNISFNQDKLKSTSAVLNHISKKLPYHDSLSFHFSNLIGATRFVPNTSAYDNFKSKGFEIIENDSLRKAITGLYSVTFNHIIGFEFADDHRHQYEILFPEVIKSVRITEMWKHAEAVNYNDLVNNPQLSNALTTNIFYRTYMIGEYTMQKENVLQVIDLIKQELAKN